MTKVNQLDFTGTTIFCGLDVHKVSWRVNLRDSELELKDFTQPADANLLHKHLTKNLFRRFFCINALQSIKLLQRNPNV